MSKSLQEIVHDYNLGDPISDEDLRYFIAEVSYISNQFLAIPEYRLTVSHMKELARTFEGFLAYRKRNKK